MSTQPTLNFKQLFNTNKEDLSTKGDVLPSGWVSIYYDKEKKKIVTSTPIESITARILYNEKLEESNKYIQKLLEEHERQKEELIEEIGLSEYERLYKVYPDDDDEEEDYYEDEELDEEFLEDNYEDVYDDYYDKF